MDEEIINVNGIAISVDAIRVPKDMTYRVQYAISPYNATNKNVTWSSSDESVFTIDGDGKIRGIEEGTGTVTVTTEDGNYTASCSVLITEPVTHVTPDENLYEHTPSSKQVFYDGDYVTCYPGSNQTDDGKLNLEFNMARLVTRVTSKNFCVTRPAFNLSRVLDEDSKPMIKVESGQASINGMDLIITQTNRIYPPDEEGDYYLALHLWRDSSSNVLGDLIVGVLKQFKGVYLDWFRIRDGYDNDALWLGKIHYDGNDITLIEEDQEKYGRLWAKDITTNTNDWKHPEYTSMVLQDWIDKVPDWYVSKEGDVVFGPIEFLDGRSPIISGTLQNHEDLGSGLYGLRFEVSDGNSYLTFKQPNTSEDSIKTLKFIANDTHGISGNIGGLNFYANRGSSNTSVLMSADGRLTLTGKNDVLISDTGIAKLELCGSVITLLGGASSINDDVSLNFFANGVDELSVGNDFKLDVETGGDVTTTVNSNIQYLVGYNSRTHQYETNAGDVSWMCKTFTVDGDLTAARVFNAVYNDLVEYMEKANEFEEIEAGDVVVFTEDGTVTKPVGNIDDVNRIAGIVSSPETMGLVLGGDGLRPEEKVPVALAGRVYLNTGDLNVQAGDLIALGNNGSLRIVGDYSRAVLGKATKHSENGKTYVLVK